MFFDVRALAESRKVAEKVATASLLESKLVQLVSTESRKVAKVAAGESAILKFANSQGNSQNEGLPESLLGQQVSTEIRRFAEFADPKSANFKSATEPRYWRFRLTAKDSGIIEVSTTPFSTLAEIQRMYPTHTVEIIEGAFEQPAPAVKPTPKAPAPTLNARCNDCALLNRSTINPKGGLVDCIHLDHGRLQMTPLEPRNCQWFESPN